MITFACPGCGQNLRAEDDWAGQQVRCPACARVVLVPGTAAAVGTPVPAPPAPPEDSVAESPPEVANGSSSGLMPVADATEMWATRVGSAASAAPAEAAAEVFNPEEYGFLAQAQAADELGRLGPYRILKVLGVGGMGVVFQAEDPRLKRIVAIKTLLPTLAAKPSNRDRFLREAQATAAIEHEHIVTIYQVDESRNVPYLVMQFLQGEPLEARLRREHRLPLREVLRIGREIAEGLTAAHERGLIHRDIKPANIWLEGARGRVKILDFGLARVASEDSHLTQSGIIVGTPSYMAPEQARGRGIDHRSDLFSLGCVLYRMCTGELPFQGVDTLSILVALALENPRPVRELNPDVPPVLADLVMKLLAKNPADRPDSARAVAEALALIEAGERPYPGALLPPISPAPETMRPPRLYPSESDSILDINEDIGLEGGDSAEQAPTLGGHEGLRLELDDDEETPDPEESSEEMEELPAQRLDELVGKTLAHYEISQVLGHGHHGVVFRAHDLEKDREVALKVLSPEFPQDDGEAQCFIRALRPLLSLRHPNVVSVYGAGKTGPYCWIVLEYVEGGNAAQLIERLSLSRKKIDWRIGFRVAIHITRALEFIDRHHLTHRNITPQNILWQSSEKVAKLSDIMYVEALDGSLLREGIREGKRWAELPYLSPEQTEGDEHVDMLSDLYSLGAVVYALLTARPPFEGESAEETLDLIRQGGPAKPRKYQRAIPGDFEWVVMTMLSRDRKYRFQTPTELLAHLDHIAAEHGIKV